MIELFNEFTTSDWLQLSACVAEIAAVLYAARAISKSSKQQLFQDRLSAYLLSKELLETYKYYIGECHKYDSQCKNTPVSLMQRYKWLTNSTELVSIREAISCTSINDINNKRELVLSKCADLESKAESIGLLWGRGRKYWFAKELRDFIRCYSRLLQAIMRYQVNKVKYDDAKTKINSARNKVRREKLLENLTSYKNKMVEAEQMASNIDDEMADIYKNRILQKPITVKGCNDKPEEALIVMKDDIRL